MCSARLIRRLPARESRWRCCWPEEASRGAVPFQDAKWSRLVNRWMLPTSASSRAALEGPMPGSWSSVEPRASTRARISFWQVLDLAVGAFQLGDQLGCEARGGSCRRCRGAWWPRSGSGLVPRTGTAWPRRGAAPSSSRWIRLMVWVRARPSSSRRSASRPSTTRSGLTSSMTRFGDRSAASATECASTGSVLRPLPVAKTLHLR